MLIERAGGRCQRCGYRRYNGALCFHHRDPSQKQFKLSSLTVQRKLEAVLKEADKCDLLCANCHAEVHAGIEAEGGVLETQSR